MANRLARSHPHRLNSALRRSEVLRLRLSGLSLKEIGARMGFTPARACQLIRRELDRLNGQRTEDAAALRQLECQRLDAALAAIWPKVEAGDLRAIDRLVNIVTVRARLLGLNLEPVAVQQPGTVVLNWLPQVIAAPTGDRAAAETTLEAITHGPAEGDGVAADPQTAPGAAGLLP